ncbi:hypothetical protein [Asticcacaulis sp.]|uniref:hypothetical protein n=1 Tax=Asticcacaulis sp. TaxID=1872648 RepID=UPI002C2AD574|nr:hypothetical protein [Asticcacaulis sp.]HTM81284.1 hypothetical protein [Asticcacaulis sp.]
MAPLIAELLPGATRVSSSFVFPIEMLIWGSGAVFARYFVRRFRLGWFNLVLLAVALSMAEELLIQQTSFASLVVQLKGVEYARAFGFNYVYFIWAVLYEAIFVVLIPVALCEMIFPKRREETWLNIGGMIPLLVLFLPACYAAWYGWNMSARPMVFHLSPYVLPVNMAVTGAVALAAVLLLALGPARRVLAAPAKPLTPPHPVVMAVLGVLTSGLIFALLALAMGIAPQITPLAPVAAGLVLTVLMLVLVPRWLASPQWRVSHMIAMTYSMVWGNCALMFLAFQDGGFDFYGKAILDALGALLMIWLSVHALRKKA